MKYLIKLKSEILNSGSLKTYLPLALGELILIVIGIYLAFQAENWREDRKEERELKEYLKNISKAIEDDLLALESFHKVKKDVARKSLRIVIKATQEKLSIEDAPETSFVLRNAFSLERFHINQSAFDAIKNSGFLNQLHGNDLEALLYRYYQTAIQLEEEIDDYQDHMQQYSKDIFTKHFDNGLINLINFPQYVTEPEMNTILSDPMVRSVYAKSVNEFQKISDLLVVGKIVRNMIAGDRTTLENNERTSLEILKDFGPQSGNPHIYSNGIQSRFVTLQSITNDSFVEFIYAQSSSLKVDYPKGKSWGVVLFYLKENTMVEKPYRDYSKFSKILLELKGEKGGEKIEFGIKDDSDPDDNSEEVYPLVLENKFKDYTIPLEGNFSNADLSRLHQVAVFVFKGADPITVYIKKIQFLE